MTSLIRMSHCKNFNKFILKALQISLSSEKSNINGNPPCVAVIRLSLMQCVRPASALIINVL